MASDDWLTFSEATEFIGERSGASIGRSQALMKAALSSGEVRSLRSLLAFDGILAPGETLDKYMPTVSKDDLVDWLDRHHPQAPAVTRQPKGKGGRPPSFNRNAVAAEVRRLMDHHGEFSADDPEWNAQARLIEAVRKKFGEASDSTLEPYIKEPLAAWRNEKAASPKT